MNLYYRGWYYLFRAVAPTVAHMQVRGLHHVPKTGACLLVSNHISLADPPCLMGYVPRHLHFMTKAEAFEQWPLGVLMSPGQPIKVHRGRADRQALRQAEAFLKQGEVVAIFAEGTRAKGGEAQEARAGVVFLAHRTGVPILPVAISGTERLFSKRFPWYRRVKVQMNVGPPFTLAELGEVTRDNRDEIAQWVMARVAELLPPAYRGVYEARRGEPISEPVATVASTGTPSDHGTD